MAKQPPTIRPELQRKPDFDRKLVLIDSTRCRVWSGHSRDMSRVTATLCTGLITSIENEGQEAPAIVRPVIGDPNVDYEIIVGALRHYAVSHIRTNRPELMLLAEVQMLTDEEAFRRSDAENRDRTDLSDRERAIGYLWALEQYYGGHQGTMAAALHVTDSWLSRSLAIARLHPKVVAAFHHPSAITITHAAKLAPELKRDERLPLILATAALLATEQEENRRTGEAPIKPARVVERLLGKTKPSGTEVAPADGTSTDQGGPTEADRGASPTVPTLDEIDADHNLVASGFKQGDDLTINVPGGARRDPAEVAFAVSNLLARLFGDAAAATLSATTSPPPNPPQNQGRSSSARSKSRKRYAPTPTEVERRA